MAQAGKVRELTQFARHRESGVARIAGGFGGFQNAALVFHRGLPIAVTGLHVARSFSPRALRLIVRAEAPHDARQTLSLHSVVLSRGGSPQRARRPSPPRIIPAVAVNPACSRARRAPWPRGPCLPGTRAAPSRCIVSPAPQGRRPVWATGRLRAGAAAAAWR